MKLAWLTKIPTDNVPVRGDGATTLHPKLFPSPLMVESVKSFSQNAPAAPETTSPMAKFWESLSQQVKRIFRFAPSANVAGRQSFLIRDRHWEDQVQKYAESPFDESLFMLKKRPNEYAISKAWAEGIRSTDMLQREAALSLLRAYMAYSDMDGTDLLSAHTQMKLMIFSPHLTEGALGRAILYESLLALPLAQFLEFAAFLRKDFVAMPPLAQALILKQMVNQRKDLETTAEEDDRDAFRQLVKDLVIQFYSMKQEELAQVLNQQEKIRLGFLKIQPVEEAYRKALEEIERRYRLKLRQLKKRRAQKVAEAEEERLRRIELIYDTVEGSLITGLNELKLDLDKVLVS